MKRLIVLVVLLLLALPVAAQKEYQVDAEDTSWKRLTLRPGKYKLVDKLPTGAELYVALDLEKSKPINCFGPVSYEYAGLTSHFDRNIAKTGRAVGIVSDSRRHEHTPTFELHKDCKIRYKVVLNWRDVFKSMYGEPPPDFYEADYVFRRIGNHSGAKMLLVGNRFSSIKLRRGSYKMEFFGANSVEVHLNKEGGCPVPEASHFGSKRVTGLMPPNFTISETCDLFLRDANRSSHRFQVLLTKTD